MIMPSNLQLYTNGFGTLMEVSIGMQELMVVLGTMVIKITVDYNVNLHFSW
jgi:hypothetical protein